VIRLGLVTASSLSKDELQAKLGKSAKITSTRLGELVKTGMVVKTAEDGLRITTHGVMQVQKEIIPKIKAKKNL
jgi:DNA-binding HxlR family transcriptional regulator